MSPKLRDPGTGFETPPAPAAACAGRNLYEAVTQVDDIKVKGKRHNSPTELLFREEPPRQHQTVAGISPRSNYVCAFGVLDYGDRPRCGQLSAHLSRACSAQAAALGPGAALKMHHTCSLPSTPV